MTVRGSYSVRVSGSVPGVVLRALLVVIALGSTVLLVDSFFFQLCAFVLATLGAIAPRTFASWASIAVIVIALALKEPEIQRLAIAILAVHAVHVLASLTLVVPAMTKIQLRVLRGSLARFLLVQAIVLPVALGAMVLMADGEEVGYAWLAPIAAGSLLVAITVIMMGFRRRQEPRVRPTSGDPMATISRSVGGPF